MHGAAPCCRGRGVAVTTLIILALLLLLVGAVVFRPLFSAESDAPTGTGLESGPETSRPDRKAMAAEEHEALQGALAEQKISPQDYAEEVARISGSGGATGPDADSRESEIAGPARQPSAYPLGAAIGWGSVAVLSILVAFIVEDLDIRRTDAPPGFGPASLAEAQAPGVPSVPEDFVADIDAMIGQLETRILSGDIVEEDIEMLSRSYTVLGREGDLTGFLQSAVDRNPDHPILLLALGIRLYGQMEPESIRRAEPLFDRIISGDPEHPVAQWYKSLILARQGDVDGAVERLRLVQVLVAADPQASSVVAELIERLTNPLETGAEREGQQAQ